MRPFWVKTTMSVLIMYLFTHVAEAMAWSKTKTYLKIPLTTYSCSQDKLDSLLCNREGKCPLYYGHECIVILKTKDNLTNNQQLNYNKLKTKWLNRRKNSFLATGWMTIDYWLILTWLLIYLFLFSNLRMAAPIFAMIFYGYLSFLV